MDLWKYDAPIFYLALPWCLIPILLPDDATRDRSDLVLFVLVPRVFQFGYQRESLPRSLPHFATAGLLSVECCQEMDMTGVAIAIVMGALVAILLPLMLSSDGWRAVEDKARARRLAEAKMNARLLRLNL